MGRTCGVAVRIYSHACCFLCRRGLEVILVYWIGPGGSRAGRGAAMRMHLYWCPLAEGVQWCVCGSRHLGACLGRGGNFPIAPLCVL